MKLTKYKEKVKRKINIKQLVSALFIVLGALLASFSVACILLPNDAIDYGTAGIAIIISKLTHVDLTLCVLLVFLPFLVLGQFFLGEAFSLRALIGSVAYMVGLEIFEKIPFELNTEHYLAVAFGGALLGFGLSLILRAGGCIDGSEILANILVSKIAEKKNVHLSMTGILTIFNACVYATVFVLINRNSALMSLLVYFVATLVIDHFTDRFEAVKQVTIICKTTDKIVKYIRDDMKKTCTIMDSYGAVSGENKTVICYVNYFELQDLRENIKELEKNAFVIISNVDEILK